MAKKNEQTFRELEAELEVVLTRVEQAEYEELDELLKDYGAAKQLIDKLEEKLTAAKSTIKKVTKA